MLLLTMWTNRSTRSLRHNEHEPKVKIPGIHVNLTGAAEWRLQDTFPSTPWWVG